MRKETENQAPSSVMEGMTSIRAILSATCKGASKIEKILFDKERLKKIGKEVNWLRHRGEEFGFPVEESSAEEMEQYTTGNSHGGVIAFVSPREIPLLREAKETVKSKGFYVMIEGIEDPYNFGYANCLLCWFFCVAKISTLSQKVSTRNEKGQKLITKYFLHTI